MATLEQMYTPQAFSPQTALSQDIGASDTRIYVANVNVFPTPPTLATIGTDAASAETVKITAKGTNFIDVQRGLLGTAKSWTTNSVIARNFSAADQAAIQNNINTLNATKLESVEADDVVNNTLTNDKLAKVATNTLKGRKSVNQGNVEDLSASDVRAMLDIQKGADVTHTVLEAAGDTTIADNDKLVLVDVSVSSGSKIRTVLWSAIKTALNNLFVPKTRTVNKKALSEDISLTAADVGADAKGTATSAVSNHNSDASAHSTLFETKQDKIQATGLLYNSESDGLTGYTVVLAAGESYDAQKAVPSMYLMTNYVASRAIPPGANLSLNHIPKLALDNDEDIVWQPAIPNVDYVKPPLNSSALPVSGTALAANTMYSVSAAVSTYVFVPPSSNGWAHGIFIAGTSPNITFSGTIIGKLPTFEANKKYEFDVLANTWIVQEIVSQS